MAYSSLSPVSAALYTTLNVAGMTALATGGVGDDIAQKAGWPFLLFEVFERTVPTMGTRPGTGRMVECEIRLHAFAKGESQKSAQLVLAKAVELLATAPTVTGYSSWAIFHDDAIPLGDVEVAGEKVKEIVQICRLMAEEA